MYRYKIPITARRTAPCPCAGLRPGFYTWAAVEQRKGWLSRARCRPRIEPTCVTCHSPVYSAGRARGTQKCRDWGRIRRHNPQLGPHQSFRWTEKSRDFCSSLTGAFGAVPGWQLELGARLALPRKLPCALALGRWSERAPGRRAPKCPAGASNDGQTMLQAMESCFQGAGQAGWRGLVCAPSPLCPSLHAPRQARLTRLAERTGVAERGCEAARALGLPRWQQGAAPWPGPICSAHGDAWTAVLPAGMLLCDCIVQGGRARTPASREVGASTGCAPANNRGRVWGDSRGLQARPKARGRGMDATTTQDA